MLSAETSLEVGLSIIEPSRESKHGGKTWVGPRGGAERTHCPSFSVLTPLKGANLPFSSCISPLLTCL